MSDLRFADVGWAWEGQGTDPGVPPSIFGVGDAANLHRRMIAHIERNSDPALAEPRPPHPQ